MNGYFNITYDFFDNPQWDMIAHKAKVKPAFVIAFIDGVFKKAYTNLNRGEFEYYDIASIAFRIGLTLKKAKLITQELIEFEFLEHSTQNICRIKNYEKYQKDIKNFQNRDREQTKEERRKEQIRQAQENFRNKQTIIKNNHNNQDVINLSSNSNQTVIKSNRSLCTKNKEQESVINNTNEQNQFNIFWDMCLRKEGKKKVYEKFVKLLNDDKTNLLFEKIINGLRSYNENKVGTELKYIKQPLTWLNGQHWDDNYENKQINNQNINFLKAYERTNTSGASNSNNNIYRFSSATIQERELEEFKRRHELQNAI